MGEGSEQWEIWEIERETNKVWIAKAEGKSIGIRWVRVGQRSLRRRWLFLIFFRRFRLENIKIHRKSNPFLTIRAAVYVHKVPGTRIFRFSHIFGLEYSHAFGLLLELGFGGHRGSNWYYSIWEFEFEVCQLWFIGPGFSVSSSWSNKSHNWRSSPHLILILSSFLLWWVVDYCRLDFLFILCVRWMMNVEYYWLWIAEILLWINSRSMC